jgi:hypothetical protein
MRVLSVLLLLAGRLSSQSAISPRAVAPIDEILARVQTNTGQFAQSLPDFVCDEKVTSKAVKRSRPHRVVIESHFVGLQKTNGRMAYTETREIVTVNGSKAAKGQKFEGPFMFGGGFSSLLEHTFSSKSAPSHTYQITGEEMLGGRPALVIEFATKESQQELFLGFYGRGYIQKDTGKAWIDKETMQVMRLERRYLNVPKGETPIVASVEYGEVRIDGKPFWMPATVRAAQTASKRWAKGEYLAAYTNYKKFQVSSEISFATEHP